jgi:hypothetical protein
MTAAERSHRSVSVRSNDRLSGRADNDGVSTKIELVIFLRSDDHGNDSAASGKQEHCERAAAKVIVIVIGLRVRRSGSAVFASSNLLRRCA